MTLRLRQSLDDFGKENLLRCINLLIYLLKYPNIIDMIQILSVLGTKMGRLSVMGPPPL